MLLLTLQDKQLEKVLTRTTGKVINPNLELLLWSIIKNLIIPIDLLLENKRSTMVRRIIKFLKKYRLPNYKKENYFRIS